MVICVCAQAQSLGGYTAGDIIVGGPWPSYWQDSAGVSTVNLPVSLAITKTPLNYSSGLPSSVNWIWQNSGFAYGVASGAGADGVLSPFHFYFNDTVDTTTSSIGDLAGMNITLAPGAGHTGTRESLQGKIAVVGAPASGQYDYVGVSGIASVTTNLGGTAGAFGNFKGGVFGGNSNVFTTPGATFLTLVTAHEFDVTLPGGASAARKLGIMIVKGSNDATRGTFEDTAIQIADQDGAGTWANGIQIGGYSVQWPLGPDSTILGAAPRAVPNPQNAVAKNGIDFSAVSFTGSPLVMPLMTPASSSDTCGTGSMKWDANFIYVCTATNTWKRAALSAF